LLSRIFNSGTPNGPSFGAPSREVALDIEEACGIANPIDLPDGHLQIDWITDDGLHATLNGATMTLSFDELRGSWSNLPSARLTKPGRRRLGGGAMKALLGPPSVHDGIRALLAHAVKSATMEGSPPGCLLVCVAPAVNDPAVRDFLVRANAQALALLQEAREMMGRTACIDRLQERRSGAPERPSAPNSRHGGVLR